MTYQMEGLAETLQQQPVTRFCQSYYLVIKVRMPGRKPEVDDDVAPERNSPDGRSMSAE